MATYGNSGKYDPKQPVHIYYDLSVLNNHPDGKRARLSFQEARTTPYVMYPENYQMSIIRFDVSTLTLPVAIFEPDDSDPSLSSWALGMKWNTFTTFQKVKCIKYNDSHNFTGVEGDEVYYIYSYQTFCNAINQAFVDGMSDLITQIANPATTAGWIAPHLVYEVNNGLFKIVAPRTQFSNTYINPPSGFLTQIYFNNDLKNALATMNYKYISSPPIATCNYLLEQTVTYDEQNFTIFVNGVATPPYETNTFIVFYQESSTLGFLNPIQNITFTSASVPIRPSLVSLPKVFGDNAELNKVSGGNNSNFVNLLTDFVVPFSGSSNTYKNGINYVPSGEYRLVDMIGNTPLTNLDLQVYWMDRYNNLKELFIEKGGYCTIKILFRRKDWCNTMID